MEQVYLRRVLGDMLVQALRDTAIADPADPIDYVAKWLLHRDEVEKQWSKFREEQKHMADDKAEYLANLAAELSRLEAERTAREEEERNLAEEQAALEAEITARLQAGEEDEEEKTETKPPAPTEEIDTSTVYSESLSETF
jgi:RNA polymerase-interacting CarD/CdnL/TRCF family regulator